MYIFLVYVFIFQTTKAASYKNDNSGRIWVKKRETCTYSCSWFEATGKKQSTHIVRIVHNYITNHPSKLAQ